MELLEKIKILSAAAKYDASCASSGSQRQNDSNGLGNAAAAPAGICHSWAADGRCISLLKILFTNYCIHDCLYCVNRRSNDIPRAAFTINELIDLTIDFYRRNYIEGLFLSSGIFKSVDYTMEIMIRIIKRLRVEHHFNGYIHFKVIPGTSRELVREAGLFADRLSVNIELPTEQGLRQLAPDKTRNDILGPMSYIGQRILTNQEETKRYKKAQPFSPAGQSTQLIVGASPEPDLQILRLAEQLYQKVNLKRVYYSAYIPVNSHHSLLPAVNIPPLRRENRLYQADWLIRFYGFQAVEILSTEHPSLDMDLDPKSAWALRNLDRFPVEINTAEYENLLRIPGVGLKSATRLVAARRFGRLDFNDLKRLGVVLRRARYFITCQGRFLEKQPENDWFIKQRLLALETHPAATRGMQLPLFTEV